MNIIGHNHVVEYFDRVLKNNALTHAYLFSGPAGVGKAALAEYVMRKVLGDTARDTLLAHPDVMVIGVEEEKKDISIDQIKNLRSRISQKPVASPYTVVLITEVEKMSTAAVNALLKTLEEPKSNALFFLTTHAKSGVIDTILSRCQLISVSAVPTPDIEAALAAQGIKDSYTIASIARGRPGHALELAEDKELYAEHLDSAKDFCKLLLKGFSTQSKYINDALPKGHTPQIQFAQQRVKQWLEVLYDILLIKTGFSDRITYEPLRKDLEKVAESRSHSELVNHYKQLTHAQTLLGQGVNAKLLLEHTLLECST